MGCRASANLDLAIVGWEPPIEDPTVDNAANRGSHMHEIMAKLNELPTGDAMKLTEAFNYVNEVRRRRRFKKLVEHTITVDWLQSQPYTTADLVLHVADEIHVLDLKTGRIPVYVQQNKQMLYYGASYLPLAPKAKGVHLHIVQPWADNMEEWYAPLHTLDQFLRDAQQVEAEILQGSTTFTPGDHCMFCAANPHGRGARGKPSCPAMLDLLYPDKTNYDEILGRD